MCLMKFIYFVRILDHWGEGVGDDGDGDEEGDNEDQAGWQDLLEVTQPWKTYKKHWPCFGSIFKTNVLSVSFNFL